MRRREMDTKTVLDQHLAVFSTGDVDKVLACRTDDSVMITPGGIVQGREALGAEFTGYFSGLFKPGTYDFTMDAVQVAGDIAYIVWHARCATADVVLGTDTFVIRDGKIAGHTWTAKIEPR